LLSFGWYLQGARQLPWRLLSEAFAVPQSNRYPIAKRIQKIVFSFIVLVTDPEAFDLVDQMIARFAANSISRQCRKVLKKQKGMAEFDSLQPHKLRIKFKKLRYSCDFFGSLCHGRKMKRRLHRFKDCLSDLQDDLGALNDISVHQKLATAVVADRKSRRHHARDFAAGAVSGREQTEIRPLLKATGKAARKLAEMRPFLT
jgi:triphosphatase